MANSDFSEIVIQTEPDSSGQKKNPNPKLSRSMATKMLSIQAFMGLLRRVRRLRRGPTRRATELESEVYHRLMDDLEDEEEVLEGSRWWWEKAYVAGEVAVFLGLVAALVVTVAVDGVKERRWERLRLWQWVTLVMVLLTGLSVVRFATFLVFAPVKWRWRVHKYVVYMVDEIKWSVDVTLWLGLVLLVWYLWFRPRLMHVRGQISMIVAHQTTRLLISLVLGSFLWTLKNVLYLKLKADLHYDQLYQRIRQTIIDLHGVQIIYHIGMWKFLTSHTNMLKGTRDHITSKEERKAEECKGNKKEEDEKSKREEEMKERTKGKNIWMDVCRMNKETVPIWILQRLSVVYLKQMDKDGLPHNRDATSDDQKLMFEAQQMLKGITCHDKRSDILPEDLNKYGLEEEEQNYLFGLFETKEQRVNRKQQTEAVNHMSSQEHRVITRDQFLSWAVVAYKNCWGLKRTLRSSERVFIKLNRILSTFLLMLMLIVWLLLSRIVDTGQLALLFTPFLAASFIFGDTCKKMFEGLVFTFAMHPFDVGDRVVIDNVQMKVTQLNILTSLFFKYDTGEEVVYPNSVLSTTKIINLDITPDQADSLEFTIPSNTPLEIITDLEIKIKKALDDDITYSSQTKVVKKEITKEDIKMVVYFKYLVSYLGAETKAMHRSLILTKIMKFNKEMKINAKKASTGCEIERLDFILDAKATMEQIDELKREMFKKDSTYKENSSVLMKGIDKNNIDMVVYIRNAKFKEDEDSKKKVEDQKLEDQKVNDQKVEDLKQHIRLEIDKLNAQFKDHGAWPRRLLEIGSLSRRSEHGVSHEYMTDLVPPKII